MGKITTKYTTIWEKMFLFLNLFQASNKQIQDKYSLFPFELVILLDVSFRLILFCFFFNVGCVDFLQIFSIVTVSGC